MLYLEVKLLQWRTQKEGVVKRSESPPTRKKSCVHYLFLNKIEKLKYLGLVVYENERIVEDVADRMKCGQMK